jgi:thiol-disulfide isomerase/thioredoxin
MSVTDPDAALDRLIDEGLLVEDEGGLRFTGELASAWFVYADTYRDVSEEVFVDTVAELFGLEAGTAERRIEELGVTREQLIGYLAAQSALEDEYDAGTLALFGQIAAEVGPPPAVPPGIETVDDEGALALAGRDRAVVTVWTHQCEPCRALKRDLDAVLAGLPEGVPVAGVEGESVPEFRAAYGVEAAPSVLVFADGEHVETVRGRSAVETYHEAFDRAFG